MTRGLSTLAAIFALALTSPARAATWFVAPTGDDLATGADPVQPLASIAAAVARAAPGDEIRVAGGTYPGGISVAALDDLAFTGGWDPLFASRDPGLYETVVAGDGASPGFHFVASRRCTLSGFTIRNGLYGVFVEDGQSAEPNLTITDTTVTASASYGVYYRGAYVIVDRCRVVSNGQDGIAGHSPYEITRGDVLHSFVAYNGGGGTYLISNQSWRIMNNVFVGNRGYGVYRAYWGPSALVYNNTIVGNDAGGVSAGYYGQLYCLNNVIAFNGSYGLNNVQSGTWIGGDFNDVYGNANGNYLNASPGVNDLSVDPLLDAGWRLLPTSPLVDRGTDLSAELQDDVDGQPRTLAAGGDGRFDIGADELLDYDRDGLAAFQGDCDDANAAAFPGAPEVLRDGVDQDCNGYDLSIQVLKASWSQKKGALSVQARSAYRSAAALSVAGFGAMAYNKGTDTWSLDVGVGASPGVVAVEGPEGRVEALVTTEK